MCDRKRRGFGRAAVLICLQLAGAALAQPYPAKAIRVVDAYPPGARPTSWAASWERNFPRARKELLALAKAKPGQLNYSSAGIGSTTHMAMELLKSIAQVDIAHVPYKSSAPAVMDGVAGHVTTLFGPQPVITPHVKAGRLRKSC